MARFLSQAWFDAQAPTRPVAGPVELTIQQHVTDGPDGDIDYVLRLDRVIIIEAGAAAAPDVTITETYETALAIHEGRLSAAAAVAAGHVRVDGAVSLLLAHSAALGAPRA